MGATHFPVSTFYGTTRLRRGKGDEDVLSRLFVRLAIVGTRLASLKGGYLARKRAAGGFEPPSGLISPLPYSFHLAFVVLDRVSHVNVSVTASNRDALAAKSLPAMRDYRDLSFISGALLSSELREIGARGRVTSRRSPASPKARLSYWVTIVPKNALS
jgi:hypothetical protein